jgi:AcrR family transcriptional regulator
MRRRKQELYAERREQIINGALQVFSTKGFLAATNKAIAEAAEINSPGLIYHYFASKEDLLRAVIEHHAPPLQLLTQGEGLLALPPEQALTQFGMAYLRLMDDPKIGACIRVLIGEAVRSPKFAAIFREIAPMRVWKLLAAYLQHKMDEGLLHPMDPALAARCFMGTFAAFMLARSILHLPEDMNVDGALLVETSVRIFLHGLQKE